LTCPLGRSCVSRRGTEPGVAIVEVGWDFLRT
jgi:hypothetical protein